MLNATLRVVTVAVLAATLYGCQTCDNGCNFDSTTSGFYDSGSNGDFNYYRGTSRSSEISACDEPDPAHCGLVGVACGFAKESWALLNVLTSYRWEGGYPDGAFHGWRGSWCGPCGEGSLDTTIPPCDPPGY